MTARRGDIYCPAQRQPMLLMVCQATRRETAQAGGDVRLCHGERCEHFRRSEVRHVEHVQDHQPKCNLCPDCMAEGVTTEIDPRADNCRSHARVRVLARLKYQMGGCMKAAEEVASE